MNISHTKKEGKKDHASEVVILGFMRGQLTTEQVGVSILFKFTYCTNSANINDTTITIGSYFLTANFKLLRFKIIAIVMEPYYSCNG